MSTLDDDTITAALTELDGWERDGDTIRRTFRLDGFRAAIDFIVRLADVADEADHHPELTNVYSRVEVVLTTHDAGGITAKDLALARAIDALSAPDR